MKWIKIIFKPSTVCIVLLTFTAFSCIAEGMGNKPKTDGGPRDKNPMAPEYFALCTANLDGSDFTEIIKDPRRQMSHARVSNDHQWITFTRFNKINSNGIAVEEDGYEQTEVMICRIDGSELESLTPPKKGVGNCISYWTPDNKGIIYVSNDNPQKQGQLIIIDLATRQKKIIPTPAGIDAADPHMVGNRIVYAGHKKGKRTRIHIINSDGTEDRTVSLLAEDVPQGDNDPKLSPDGTKVTFLRMGRKGGKVDVIVVDLEKNTEKDLSPQGDNIDALPEWSSDGKRIVFWHLDRKRQFLNSGIYTMRPDGTDRRKVPLSRQYFYTMPSFWPATGSDDDAKIIFAARLYPAILREKLKSIIN